MKALIILAAIAGFFVLVGLVPVGCAARYDGRPELSVTVGPLRFRLYPPKARAGRKKTKRTVKPKKASKAPKKQTVPAKKPDIAALRPLLGTLLDALGRARRAVRVKLLYLRVCFGGQDAAQRAIRYGQAWAVIGGVTPLLEQAFRIRRRDVQAVFDPEAETFTIELELRASVRIGAVAWIGLRCGVRALRQYLQIKNKKAVQNA